MSCFRPSTLQTAILSGDSAVSASIAAPLHRLCTPPATLALVTLALCWPHLHNLAHNCITPPPRCGNLVCDSGATLTAVEAPCQRLPWRRPLQGSRTHCCLTLVLLLSHRHHGATILCLRRSTLSGVSAVSASTASGFLVKGQRPFSASTARHVSMPIT